MSADTMPCGCLGHADHEDLCRYPALEAERDGLRAKLAQAERELGKARSDGAAAFLAGKAEAREEIERAEASSAGLRYALGALICACPDEGTPANWNSMRWLRALGVAEHAMTADHPEDALVSLANAVRQYQHRDETTLLETLRRLMDERSRIAQMRPPEYIRALERVRDAAEPFRSACLHPEPWPGGDSCTELVLSCADVDALKGKK